MSPPPTSSPDRIVFQAEDCETFVTKEGELPGGDRAAVWLSGDGASLKDAHHPGHAAGQHRPRAPVGRPKPAGCPTLPSRTSRSRISTASRPRTARSRPTTSCGQRSQDANCGAARRSSSPARQSEFQRNKLVSVTRFGGNAEAAILGRTEPIEECIFENNRVLAPPGAEAGGPTARRLLWFSTGHGSITHNWISEIVAWSTRLTAVPRGRWGRLGSAGLRAPIRTSGRPSSSKAIIAPPTSARSRRPTSGASPCRGRFPRRPTIASAPSIASSSPTTRQATRRRFWPPDRDDGTEEPPIGEYYVTIFAGTGQGQTRRVVKRTGETLHLDRPWTVPPAAGSVVAVGTVFFQNLIVGNDTPDGMTGHPALDLLHRERGRRQHHRPPAEARDLPLRQRHHAGLVDAPHLEPRHQPPLLEPGRGEPHRGMQRRGPGHQRRRGAVADRVPPRTGQRPAAQHLHPQSHRWRDPHEPAAPSGVKDTSASVAGTLVEFNVVRDAGIAYHAAASVDATVFRRNHAYFWYPVNHSPDRPVAFQVDARRDPRPCSS